MANNYRETGRPHQNKWPVGVQRMNERAQELVASGDLPQDFFEQPSQPSPERVRVYPEISLGEEFARQRQLVITRVISPLGFSESDAGLLLPKRFPERPPSFDDSNSVPVIVPKFSQFSWGETVDAAGFGMSDYLRSRLGELGAWEDPRGSITPDKPYGAWLYVGDDYLKTKPSVIRDKVREDDRHVGEHWQGLGLSVVREDIIQLKPFDLVGSSVGPALIVFVYWWIGRPQFYTDRVDYAAPSFRGLVRGSEIAV